VPPAAEAGRVAKKKSLIAREQRRPDVAERRRNFAIARRFAEPERFVFLDESGAKTSMTRLYGRSKIGERCNFHTPHGHWKTTTMISALRVDGVIPAATMLLDGPMNAVTFLGWVESCLAPSLRPGDIVVMDNLGAHKAAGVEEAIERAGASVWWLPPYSPDLNPIEKLWSKVKSWLRRVAAGTVDGLWRAAGDAFRAVTPGECANYFRSCGYRT
jgi:transposase